MSTVTAESDTTAAVKPGFQFDEKGNCTNPEKIPMRCPMGTAACVLVARHTPIGWVAGYQYGGRDLAYRTLAPSINGEGLTKREFAVARGTDMLLKALGMTDSERKITAAVVKFREVEGIVEVPARPSSDEAWTPAPNKFGYRFSKDGECLNPERVEIPTPEGYQCALFVALLASGRWTFGCVRAGKDEELHKYKTRLVEDEAACASREQALDTAVEIALDAGEPQSPINKALEAWRKAHADATGFPVVPSSAAGTVDLIVLGCVQGKRDTSTGPVLAADLYNSPLWTKRRAAAEQAGRPWAILSAVYGLIPPDMAVLSYDATVSKLSHDDRVDLVGKVRADLIEHFGGKEKAWGKSIEIHAGKAYVDLLTESATGLGIAIVAPMEGKGIGEQLAAYGSAAGAPPEVSTPPALAPVPEPPPVTEKPLAPEPVLPGVAHGWDEAGNCTNPDVVKIKLKRDLLCIVLLGSRDNGEWRAAVAVCRKMFQKFPPLNISLGNPYPTRAAALAKALSLAEGAITGEDSLKIIAKFREKHCPESGPAAPARAVTVAPRNYRTEFNEALPVAKIQPNPANHRKHFDPIEDAELAESIRLEGCHQPIAVRRLLEGEAPHGELAMGDPTAPEFEAIFGHRRLRAAKAIGLAALPARIYLELTRKQATAIALVENLQREGINAMEEAEGFAQLMVDEDLTQEGCADRVGKPRSTIANALRLLKLPASWRDFIRADKLTAEHGKAVVRFVPDEKDRAAVPKWELILLAMAEEAIKDRTPSGYLERGVPFYSRLAGAGLAVRIQGYNLPAGRLPAALQKHPAYFKSDENEWVCFDPPHWESELKKIEDAETVRLEDAKKRRDDELAKLTKGGRKQLNLSDLDSSQYRKLEDGNEGLLELVPDDKKAAAKGAAGRTTVVTDVELADRLTKAMQREIKKNRAESAPKIADKALAKIVALKKISPREFAWLVFLSVDWRGRQLHPRLTGEAAKHAGAKLPKSVLDFDPNAYSFEERENKERGRVEVFAKCEPLELVRTMMAELLPGAVADVVDSGPDSTGGRMLKWWLDTDTLWLLEESDDGRAELVDAVKNSAWYKKAVGRRPMPGDVVRWEGGGGWRRGVVVTVADYEREMKLKWDARSWADSTPVRNTGPKGPENQGIHVIVTSGLEFVGAEEESQ